jgi:hypothetical protein
MEEGQAASHAWSEMYTLERGRMEGQTINGISTHLRQIMNK